MKKLHPKVQAATVGSAVVVLLTYVLSLFGQTLPPEAAAAAATLAAFGAGYLTPGA